MALRLASKIQRSIFSSLLRSFTVKTETTVCATQNAENSTVQEHSGEPPKQFNVYKANNSSHPVETENTIRQKIDDKQLQPSMLPDYYKSEIDVQQGTYPVSDTLDHNPMPLALKQRRFEVSKTYANVTLPLKAPKLASPFPDPVKIMSSHTVSDQEKAEQMLAESRIPKATIEPTRAKVTTPNRVYTRNYSKRVGRNDEKCKKIGKKKKCVKMVTPGCKPPKNIICDKERDPIECKKIKAPYPSYSEACYEEVLQKPSECKLCPWRPKDNPNFKPSKKKYHTKTRDENSNETVTQKKLSREDNGYSLDADKKSYDNPSEKTKSKTKKNRSGKVKKNQASKKRKSKSKKKKRKKKIDKGKKAAHWTTTVRRYEETKEIEEPELVINTKMIKTKGKKKEEKKKPPCKKFPYDKCKKKKEKKKSSKKDTCKKKKKPIVKGCLNNELWETIEFSEYNQLDLAKSNKKKGSKTNDECEKKRPTRDCPADLIESTFGRRKPKRNNKKKKTSARIKPYMAKRKNKAYRSTKQQKMQEK